MYALIGLRDYNEYYVIEEYENYEEAIESYENNIFAIRLIDTETQEILEEAYY